MFAPSAGKTKTKDLTAVTVPMVAEIDRRITKAEDFEFGIDLSNTEPGASILNEDVIVKTPTGFRRLGKVSEISGLTQEQLRERFDKAEEVQVVESVDPSPIKFTPLVEALKEFNVNVNVVERPSNNIPHGMNRCAQCNRVTKSPYLCKSCEGRHKPDPNKTYPVR